MALQFFPMRQVVCASSLAPTDGILATFPNIYISIAVDCAFIVSQKGETIETGIYMMDNMVSMGSANQGSMDLNSVGNAGWLIGWNVVPIDPNLTNLSVEITFIQICTGSVLGSPPIKESGDGYSWLGQLMYTGHQTYSLQVKVTEGLTQVSYYVNWQASVTCN